MSKNKLSETGLAEDLIRSCVQMGCAEIHAQTLYYKATAELDNGLIDVEDAGIVQKQIAKLEQYREDIDTYSDLRRRMMTTLFNMFDGDRDMWCQAKHLGISAMTAFEAYQASDNDAELLTIAYDANRAFVKAMTRFLGVEITDCAACFSDMMKGASNDQDEEELLG